MERGPTRVLLIILDGIADRSQEDLGGSTPLESANKPNLDQLASGGMCGLMDPVAPGVPPASENALWSMLGYRPDEFPGRSVFEATAFGHEFEDGQVLFMGNLATGTLEEDRWYVQFFPAPVKGKEAGDLVGSLTGFTWKDLSFDVIHLFGPHFLVAPRGEASHWVTDSDPFLYRYPVRKVVPRENALDPNAAERTAEALNAFSDWARERLAEHPINRKRVEDMKPPANLVLTKWASRVRPLESLERRWSFHGCVVSSNPMQLGMAACLEMEPIRIPGTGGAEEEIGTGMSVALERLREDWGLALLQVKAADEVSHLGRPPLKVDVIEELDAGFTPFMEHLVHNKELLTVITSDHTTPCGGSDYVIHGADPVPVLFLGKNRRKDRIKRFDEVSFAGGSLGKIRGGDLMPIILDQAERSRFSACHPWPRDLPYYPPPDLW